MSEAGSTGEQSKDSNKPTLFQTSSRIFIGNLAVEKVTNKELVEIFEKYGKVIEVSIKSSYGFVQYEGILF